VDGVEGESDIISEDPLPLKLLLGVEMSIGVYADTKLCLL
jgi:hypothetical protein